jgi:hypothetical protein
MALVSKDRQDRVVGLRGTLSCVGLDLHRLLADRVFTEEELEDSFLNYHQLWESTGKLLKRRPGHARD